MHLSRRVSDAFKWSLSAPSFAFSSRSFVVLFCEVPGFTYGCSNDELGAIADFFGK